MPTSQEPSTESLIQRVRTGSLSALNDVFASIRPLLRRRAEARHARALRRKDDASDRVQDCLRKAVEKIGAFKGHTLDEMRAWLYKIIDNDMRKRHRFWARRKRDRGLEEALAPDGVGSGEPAGSTTSILDRMARREESEQVMVALSWCPEADRDVIFQHLIEERSYEEVAADRGVTCVAVRQQFSRAIRRARMAKRLQALMADRGMVGLQQEVVGIHRFQGLSAATIAARLDLQRSLVDFWIDQAGPLLRELDEGKS
jgi:RNA polymerase sigma factor (sigma-70 family)